MNKNQVVKDTTESSACPRCGRKTDYRIKRSRIVRLISLVAPLKRFWCPNCQRRFHIIGQ